MSIISKIRIPLSVVTIQLLWEFEIINKGENIILVPTFWGHNQFSSDILMAVIWFIFVGTRFVTAHEWHWARIQRAPTIWFVESGFERHDLGHRRAVLSWFLWKLLYGRAWLDWLNPPLVRVVGLKSSDGVRGALYPSFSPFHRDPPLFRGVYPFILVILSPL